MRLYLVRHAMVVFRQEQPSASWYLSAEGRAAADALAASADWSSVTRLYSSPEPKAIGTAQRIAMRHGLPLSIEPGLREVERPWSEGDYKALARRYLEGEAMDGWEPRREALQRVQAAVSSMETQSEGRDVAVVSHGLALSLLLRERLGLDGKATARMWDQIRFPDLAILDTEGVKLLKAFGS
jgi:broad specificity phosphatase PhoE